MRMSGPSGSSLSLSSCFVDAFFMATARVDRSVSDLAKQSKALYMLAALSASQIAYGSVCRNPKANAI
jgi:hypothetical protein